MDYTVREIQRQEYPLLNDFLYEAIFIPEGIDPPPKTIITSPELQVYVEHFGELKDDRGLVAEVGGKIVGAVWVRIMNDYGHIDNATPSLAISLYKEYRGFGIGTAMMKKIIALCYHVNPNPRRGILLVLHYSTCFALFYLSYLFYAIVRKF